MKLRIPTLLISLICYSISALASGSPYKDQQLMRLFSRLASADGYSYSLAITSEIAGNAKEHQTEQYIHYSSSRDFIRYSNTSTSVYFMNKNGLFKVDLKQKIAYYKLFDSDSARQKEERSFAGTDGGKMLDSLFLAHATIENKKQVNKLITCKLRYPPQSMIRELELQYHPTDSFFTSISYMLERPYPGTENMPGGAKVLRQKVIMNRYEHKAPPAVADILLSAQDIYAYLQKTYAGYTINSL